MRSLGEGFDSPTGPKHDGLRFGLLYVWLTCFDGRIFDSPAPLHFWFDPDIPSNTDIPFTSDDIRDSMDLEAAWLQWLYSFQVVNDEGNFWIGLNILVFQCSGKS